MATTAGRPSFSKSGKGCSGWLESERKEAKGVRKQKRWQEVLESVTSVGRNEFVGLVGA